MHRTIRPRRSCEGLVWSRRHILRQTSRHIFQGPWPYYSEQTRTWWRNSVQIYHHVHKWWTKSCGIRIHQTVGSDFIQKGFYRGSSSSKILAGWRGSLRLLGEESWWWVLRIHHQTKTWKDKGPGELQGSKIVILLFLNDSKINESWII